MYRFKPRYELKAYGFQIYPAKCKQAKCIMHNIMNNLNPDVAQFP
jgi:urocanate hydratase